MADEGMIQMGRNLERVATALERIADQQELKNTLLRESIEQQREGTALQKQSLEIHQSTADALLGPHE